MSVFDITPSHIARMRKGDSSDPYVSISEDKQVVGNNIYLSEIPNKMSGVIVRDGGTRLSEVYDVPNSGEFRVNYENGIIDVHHSLDRKVLNIEYNGIGLVLINSDRIFTSENNGKVVETLREVVGEANNVLELSQRFNHVGKYDSSKQYFARNIVNFNNASYIRHSTSPESISGINPNNISHWRKLSGYSWRGYYDSNETYNEGDVVSNWIYVCMAKEDGISGVDLDNQNYWQPIISIQDLVDMTEVTLENVQSSTDDAIADVNDARDQAITAKNNADTATSNANSAASNANSSANYARNTVDNKIDQLNSFDYEMMTMGNFRIEFNPDKNALEFKYIGG